MRVLSNFITHAVAPPTDVERIAVAKVREVVDELRHASGNPRERFGVTLATLEGLKANALLPPDGVRSTGLPIHPRELTVEALQTIERYLCSVDLTPLSPDASYVKALTRAFADEGVELVAIASAGGKLAGVLHIEEMRVELMAKEQDSVERVRKKRTPKKIRRRGQRQAKGRKVTTVAPRKTKSARERLVAVRPPKPSLPVLEPRRDRSGKFWYDVPIRAPSGHQASAPLQVAWLEDGAAQIIRGWEVVAEVQPREPFEFTHFHMNGTGATVTGKLDRRGLTISGFVTMPRQRDYHARDRLELQHPILLMRPKD